MESSVPFLDISITWTQPRQVFSFCVYFKGIIEKKDFIQGNEVRYTSMNTGSVFHEK
jgi:hypothetical protein